MLAARRGSILLRQSAPFAQFRTPLQKMVTTRSTPSGQTSTEGLKVAQEIAHEVEDVTGGHLDPVLGDTTPTPPDQEDATVWCFAFGSNMTTKVLSGRRMIKPVESTAAVCPGYKLTFNQPGLPYREPGFATVEPLSNSDDRVAHGVAYRMTPTEWEYYKESEGAVGQSDQGYGVVEVEVHAYDGRKLQAYTLQTQPKTIARLKGRRALPSLRYLTLLRDGAAEHALTEDYQSYLKNMQHYERRSIGSKIGGLLTSFIAFGLLFPFFALMRTYRKIRGLSSINPGGTIGRLQSKYFQFVFGLAWGLHELLCPLLGSGCGDDQLASKAPKAKTT